MKAAEILYRRLLVYVAADLRAPYGDEMMRLYRERLTRAAARGRFTTTVVALAGLLDLGRVALASHVRIQKHLGTGMVKSRGDVKVAWMSFVDDFRSGFRAVRRSPGVASMAVVTIGLGVAATAAIYAIANTVLMDPLPFPQSHELVRLWRSEPPTLLNASTSYARYLDWRGGQRVLADMGAWSPRGVTIAGPEGPERVTGAIASASFFDVVGTPPLLGRYFTSGEDSPGGDRVVVISEAIWTNRFARAPAVLGSALRIDGVAFTVAGVAPEAFAEVWSFDVWLPLGQFADPGNRRSNFLFPVGRLREGISLDVARRELGELAAQMSREHSSDRYTITVQPLKEFLIQGVGRGLWILLTASGLLLAVACANVANLLLVRAAIRERDVAIRISLGATWRRLLGNAVGESLSLGLAGGLFGLGLASGLVRVFVSMAPDNFPRLTAIEVDARVLGFSIVIAIVAAVVASIAPMFKLRRHDINAVLRRGGHRDATPDGRRLGRWLVVSEIAIAVALVGSAGVITKSVLRVQSQDLGLTRDPMLTFSVGVPPGVAGSDAIRAFHDEFLGRLRSVPGVTHASAISQLPIGAGGNTGPVMRADADNQGEGVPVALYRIVMSGYFETTATRIVAGQPLDDRNGSGTRNVVVVNEVLAGQLFPAMDPSRVVGKSVRVGGSSGLLAEIVGVSANVRSRRPELAPSPEVYLPYGQNPGPGMTYVVRADADPSTLIGAVRTMSGRVAPDVALASIQTFADVVARATRSSSLLAWLSVIFAVFAAILASVGVYTLTAYTVAQRRRELAVRSALGASRRSLMSMVLWEGFALATVGIIVGILLALTTSNLIQTQLYEVSSRDPFVLTGAATLLLLAATIGYLVPAARGLRINPADAVRTD